MLRLFGFIMGFRGELAFDSESFNQCALLKRSANNNLSIFQER